MTKTYVPATQIKAPDKMVAIAIVVPIGLRLMASIPPFKWYVSYNQKNPAKPYVYQAAKSAAAIPMRYEKIGTAMARTMPTTTPRKHRDVHTVQPSTVCEWTCSECRKNRTKTSFAAVWTYIPPAL